jgi:anti-sigma factor RsiW
MTTAKPCRSRAAILARFSAYLDGDIPASACAAIDRHCRRCSRCKALVAGLRRTVGACRKAGSAPLPAAVQRKARLSVRRLLRAGGPA